jgi:nitrate reductase NapAB chaperone NapD
MAICSYLVIPDPGETESVSKRLSSLPGCDVIRARNREVLLLLTETAGAAEEAALRREIEGVDGIQALVLTFGEIPDNAGTADATADGAATLPGHVEP